MNARKAWGIARQAGKIIHVNNYLKWKVSIMVTDLEIFSLKLMYYVLYTMVIIRWQWK